MKRFRFLLGERGTALLKSVPQFLVVAPLVIPVTQVARLLQAVLPFSPVMAVIGSAANVIPTMMETLHIQPGVLT